MAKVPRHFAVSSRVGIDCLRPANLRDLASNSTAEAGQYLIRSLSAFVNRLLNVDLSDHARKMSSSAKLSAFRKDGGIGSIAVGNAQRRFAAVKPSLARQLSHTEICVGIHGACEADAHAIRRYVMDNIELDQSHQDMMK